MESISNKSISAAWTLSIAALLSFSVAMFLIGPRAITEPGFVNLLAIEKPYVIYIQDFLKLLMAGCYAILIGVFRHLLQVRKRKQSTLIIIMAWCSVLALAANGVLSSIITASGNHLSADSMGGGLVGVNILAVVSLVSGGLWLFFTGLLSARTSLFTKTTRRLIMATGICSILIPLAIVALLLTIIWAFLLANWLKQNQKEISKA